MAPDLSRLSINQATTRPQWSLEQAIAGYAAAGVRGIGVWPDKLAECGVARARHLLADHGMTATSVALGRMFASGGPVGRELDRYRRVIDDAAEIGARCIVAVAGTIANGATDLAGARSRMRDGFRALAPHADDAGVPLAIEAIHPMQAAELSCVNTLGQALDLCDELGGRAGVAVDAYHVWWDPHLDECLGRAAGRILSFQVSDWLVPTRDIMAGRGMMGDGAIDLTGMAAKVAASGYDGFREVEIMSAEDWWRRPGEETVAACVERYLRIFRPPAA